MRVIAKLKEAGRIIFHEVINMAGIILLEDPVGFIVSCFCELWYNFSVIKIKKRNN